MVEIKLSDQDVEDLLATIMLWNSNHDPADDPAIKEMSDRLYALVGRLVEEDKL